MSTFAESFLKTQCFAQKTAASIEVKGQAMFSNLSADAVSRIDELFYVCGCPMGTSKRLLEVQAGVGLCCYGLIRDNLQIRFINPVFLFIIQYKGPFWCIHRLKPCSLKYS